MALVVNNPPPLTTSIRARFQWWWVGGGGKKQPRSKMSTYARFRDGAAGKQTNTIENESVGSFSRVVGWWSKKGTKHKTTPTLGGFGLGV